MAILTVTELRKHVAYPTGTDGDAALQRLLNAAELAIVKRAGAAGAITELVPGGWSTLVLNRPIASLTTVTEDFDGTPLVLAADDYRFTANGYVLRRLTDGTNSGSIWSGMVQVAYTVTSDTASRELAQILLVQAYLNFHPGLVSQTIGDWSETYASGEPGYREACEDALAGLDVGVGMVVV